MAIVLIILIFGGLLLLTFAHNAIAFLTPYIWLVLYVFIVWRIGKAIDNKRAIQRFQFILPAFAIVVPSAWFYAGLNEFNKLCAASKGVQIVRYAQVPQDGFLFDFSSLSKRNEQVPEELVANGYFLYYEVPERQCPGCWARQMTRDASVGSGVRNRKIQSIESKYEFKSEPVQEIASWWLPSVYKIRYIVADRSSREVLAEGVEYVFGGGVFGVYIHAVLGERGDYSDRDFSMLGCGYASTNPGAWRPRFSTNPNHARYQNADKEMLGSLRTRAN